MTDFITNTTPSHPLGAKQATHKEAAMRTIDSPDTKTQKIHLGLIKWFGGFNQKKDKENDFGFILAPNGEDIYIHKSEVRTTENLRENDLVTFHTREKNGKKYACNLYSASENVEAAIDATRFCLLNHEELAESTVSATFTLTLRNLINKRLSELDKDFLDGIEDEVSRHVKTFSLIAGAGTWPLFYKKFFDSKDIGELLRTAFPYECIPRSKLVDKDEEIYQFLHSSDEDFQEHFFEKHMSTLPISTILASVGSGILTKAELIEKRFNELCKIFENLYRDKSSELPDYVKAELKKKFKTQDEYLTNPTLCRILEPIIFKKRLYEKRLQAIDLYSDSKTLHGRIEYFVLGTLFGLLLQGNSADEAYPVFLHNLWKALVAKTIDPSDPELFKLFPSCITLGEKLSCEAVYWPKVEIFLCRGRECSSPKVIPRTGRHYLDFTAYDWFKHYGVNYLNESAPHNRDFPIKLAGYMNRLKEIFERLHCKACDDLMLPNLRYARVEYNDYEDGKPVKKSMAAAFRATVFKCANDICTEFGQDYYINNCREGTCYAIIDSRDLKTKCSVGLYICGECGSCCDEHAKAHPLGLCPECAAPLTLYADSGSRDRFGNIPRMVQCSNDTCGFHITSHLLPKKFNMPNCKVSIR